MKDENNFRYDNDLIRWTESEDVHVRVTGKKETKKAEDVKNDRSANDNVP